MVQQTVGERVRGREQPQAAQHTLVAGKLWLLLRVSLSLWIAYCSSIYRRMPLEQTVGVWPPAAPFGQWLQRVFVQPWQRWDVGYYLNIATRGYRTDDGTAQFHPLFPLLGGVVGRVLGGNLLLGLLVVSSACAWGTFVAFERLALLDLPAPLARHATIFFALTPVAFVLFAPYSEALFLVCSIGALYYARRQCWWLAGVCGGLAVLTRQQGIFLVLPLLWEAWEAAVRDWRKLVRSWRMLFGIALVPLGLLVWLVYRAVALADVSFDWHQPHTLIYSLLISKSSAQVVPVQGFMVPWRALWLAMDTLDQPDSFRTLLDLAFGGVALLALLCGGRTLWRLRPSYLIYSVVLLLVTFGYYTGPKYPYMGLPRHCLLAFPLALPLAMWGKRPAVRVLVIVWGVLGILLLVRCYSAQAWVP